MNAATAYEMVTTEAKAIEALLIHSNRAIESGLMSEIESEGKMLAYMLTETKMKVHAPNVVAAVLEELRAEWTRLYEAEVAAARTSIEGVRVERNTGRIMVEREGREERAAANRAKLANRHVPAEAKKIPLGTFTVEHADSAAYETIKIERVEGGNFDGKVIASFINGPDNETSFKGFCFINPENLTIKVWSRFSGIDERWVRAVQTVLLGDSDKSREAYARIAGRCSRCGRKITRPDSLDRGMGSECAGKED